MLFYYLNQALASLKEDAKASGEVYKYDILEMVYIQGMTYEEIARKCGCGKNSPKRWCKSMVPKLAVKLFGARAIEENFYMVEAFFCFIVTYSVKFVEI